MLVVGLEQRLQDVQVRAKQVCRDGLPEVLAGQPREEAEDGGPEVVGWKEGKCGA